LEKQFKANLLMFIGLGFETAITLQYLSYRTAIEELPLMLPSYDLSAFSSAASAALPHLDALSDNTTLIFPGNLSMIEGLLSTTFFGIGQELNNSASGDLTAALAEYSTELETIRVHMLGVADSWLAAGNALATIWPSNSFMEYLPLIVIGAAAVGLTIVVVIYVIRNTKSQ